jgi:hypothetical protein
MVTVITSLVIFDPNLTDAQSFCPSCFPSLFSYVVRQVRGKYTRIMYCFFVCGIKLRGNLEPSH